VDVVGATDYLLRLLAAPLAMTSRLALAGDAGLDRGRAYADEETADRLIRRRLDARGPAVRLGMRLIAGLRGGVAAPDRAARPDCLQVGVLIGRVMCTGSGLNEAGPVAVFARRVVSSP
jgi:hypothetical protein